MATINKYKLWCNDEKKYVYIWNDDEPIVCPNVNTHSINIDSISIEESISEAKVIIDEESSNKTGGHFRVESQNFVAKANTTTNHDFSYPIKLGVLVIEVPTEDNQKGDIMSCLMAPETVVGTLSKDAEIGDNIFNVSQTVTDNVKIGYFIHLNNEDVGQVLNIDKANGTITTENKCKTQFSASSPTLVKMTVCFMRDWEIGRSWLYNFGNSKIGASVADENTPVRIVYKNNSNEDKRIRTTFEILY